MLLFILAYIIPSVFAYDRADCNCETLLDYTDSLGKSCHWVTGSHAVDGVAVTGLNPQTGTNGRVVCDFGMRVEHPLNLQNADLRGAYMHNIQFMLPMDCSSNYLCGIDIRNAIFDGAYLEGAVFEWLFVNVFSFWSLQEPSFLNVDGTFMINRVKHGSSGSSFTQADVDAGYDAGYDAGVASVTPEDGIGQEDVDEAVALAVNALKASESELVAAYKELKC